MEGWKDGRMEAKAGLRIAYSNQKSKIAWQKKLLGGKKLKILLSE